MKDFDDFEAWFSENCAAELKEKMVEVARSAAEKADNDDSGGATFDILVGLTKTQVNFKLRKYHEWLSEQLG